MHLSVHYNDDHRESAHKHYNVSVSVHIIMIARENKPVNIIMCLLGHYNDDSRELAHEHYNALALCCQLGHYNDCNGE